jgi:hypothetical protein
MTLKQELREAVRAFREARRKGDEVAMTHYGRRARELAEVIENVRGLGVE